MISLLKNMLTRLSRHNFEKKMRLTCYNTSISKTENCCTLGEIVINKEEIKKLVLIPTRVGSSKLFLGKNRTVRIEECT